MKKSKRVVTDYRDRFGLARHPFNKNFLRQNHVETEGTKRLKERFHWLQSERGIGLLTGPSGVGKTATLGAIAEELPKHQRRVLYIEDSGAGTGDLFRYIAYELGLTPAFRRAALWRDLKSHVLKLEEENDQQVILVIDDAHRLPSAFLNSLGGFLNFAFDSRDLLTVWLVGDSRLTGILGMAAHQHLKTRIRLKVHLDPFTREELVDYVEACLGAAGSTRQIVSDTALDAVFHLSRGIPRTAGKLLGIGLRIAHQKDKDIVCDRIIEETRKEVLL
jgi:type II secretory pathway predicted ATPase ExeA